MKPEDLRPVARQLLRTYQVRSTRSRNLALALAKGDITTWNQGDVLCNEGEPSNSMFVTIEGEVQVLKRDAFGVPKELAVIPAPSMIGQMGLVDGSSRSATCVAHSTIKGITISKIVFNALLQEQSPEGSAFRHLLISTMMGQLSSANVKISGLVDDMVEEQTADIPRENTAEANKEKLMKIAGVLDGWDVKAEEIEDVKFVEDEDMRRTREARQKTRRW
jgi:CRP-like cAMP-binding protein